MELNVQTMFNALVTVCCFFGGWILNNIRDSVATSVKDQKVTADKVAHIEKLVVGEYVKREELQASIAKLEHAIERNNQTFERGVERLLARIDGKADKQH